MAGRSKGGTIDHPDETTKQDEVYDTQDDQEDQVGQSEAAENEIDQGSKQDISQCDRNKDQPGKLHELVCSQAR